MTGTHLTADELVDYLHGELPVVRDAAIAMHLAECAECRAAGDREAALTEMVRAVAVTQQRSIPPSVTDSIRAAALRPAPRRSTANWFGRRVFALPIAVAAALLIWFGVRNFSDNQPKTTIAAGYLVNRHAMLSAITPFADDAPVPPAFASNDASH